MSERGSFRFGRGDRLGRYVLVEELGRGAAGVVVLCYDPQLDRRLALKVLDPGLDRERVLDQARSAARLVHPHLVTVHDVGSEGGDAFIAMEHLGGGTLAAWAAGAGGRRPTPREVLERFCAAGEGLAAAHRAGLAHGFGPSNVLLDDQGRPRLCDLGLPTRPSADSTQPDARSDQLAFSRALFEALAGPRGRLPLALSSRTRRALRRGLSPRPEDRFPSMEDLLGELRAQPGSHRVAWLALAAGVTGVALGAAVWRFGPDVACAPETLRWEEAERVQAHAAFLATGRPWAESAWTDFEESAELWAARWSKARRQACLAGTGGHAASACLGRGMLQAGAVLALASQADATFVDRAGVAVRVLPSPEACAAEGEPEAALDQGSRERVAQVRPTLAKAQALLDTGAWVQARELARTARQQAEATSYGPLVAEAQYLEGRAAEFLGDLPNAVEALKAAAWAADAAGHDRLRLLAASALAYVMGQEQRHPKEAAPWLGIAASALRRVGSPPELAAEVEAVRGLLRYSEDDFVGAERHLRRAEELLEPLGDRGLVALTRVRAWRSSQLSEVGRDQEAEELARVTLAKAAPLLRPGHPDRIRAVHAIAYAKMRRGDAHGAVAIWRTLVPEQEAAAGPGHAWSVGGRYRLAGMLLAIDQPEEALTTLAPALESAAVHATHARLRLALAFRHGEVLLALEQVPRALEAFAAAEALQGPERDVPWESLGQAMSGEALLAAGRPAEALAAAEVSLRLVPDEYRPAGATAPFGWVQSRELAVMVRGRALLELGRLAEAVPDLERAVAARAGQRVHLRRLALARFSLARALERTDRERAKALAQEALADLDALPRPTSWRPELERWLERR